MSRTLAGCGTMAAYGRGCRCDECRAANTDRVRRQVRAKGVKPVVLAPCGTKAARDRHRRNGEQCEECALKPRTTHPCGTWQSKRRHRRNGETCAVCDIQTTTPRPATQDTPAPCGTTTARQRHKRNGETCDTCGPERTLQPCGTAAAAKRHRAHAEPVCDPCLQAERDYTETRRRKQGSKPTNTTPTNELIEELRFLLNAGEGTHRILTATGYKGREHTLRTRLGKAGHHQLAAQILNPWDLAA